MDLYYTENEIEKTLQKNADIKKIPLGGALELLPLCNMDCKMCYVKQTKDEMSSQGRMLSCDEWIEIIRQGAKEGLLFLLLTGGEPLLYPEFKRLYCELKKMGIVLSLNTNGTLINEAWADFFAEHGVRRINVTLYGKDDETYSQLCGNPHGFSQVMNACHLLKERDIPFRLTCSITPDNKHQLKDFLKISQDLQVPFAPAFYMFPATRRGKTPSEQFRLSPEEAAKLLIEHYQLENPDVNMDTAARQSLTPLFLPNKTLNHKGFTCHAGHSGFWLNWKGEMLPCGIFEEPKISLVDYSFNECWQHIVSTTQKMTFCNECQHCEKRNICSVCPASCYTETGQIDGCPEYICKFTDAQIQILENYIIKK